MAHGKDKGAQDRAERQHKLAGDAAAFGEDATAGAATAAERVARTTEEAKAALHGLDAGTRLLAERGVTIVEQALALYQEQRDEAKKRADAPMPTGVVEGRGLGDFITIGADLHKAHNRVAMARDIYVNGFAGNKNMDPLQAFTRADEFIAKADEVLAEARAKDRKAMDEQMQAHLDGLTPFTPAPSGDAVS